MKKVLLLMVAVLMVSSVAMATPHYGVYTDCTGTSCALAAGFTQTVAVVEKFSVGTSGARFKVTLPAGSSFFGFSTGFVPLGNLTTDLSLGYGGCFSGTTCLGTIAGILILGTIDSILTLSNIAAAGRQIATGLAILVVLVLYARERRLRQ